MVTLGCARGECPQGRSGGDGSGGDRVAGTEWQGLSSQEPGNKPGASLCSPPRSDVVQDEGVKHHPGQGSRLPLSRQTPCVPPRTAWLLQARSPCPRPQHWGGGRGGEYVSFFKDRTQELDLSPPLEPVGRSRGRTQPQGTVKRRVAGWASVPGSSSVPREGGVGEGPLQRLPSATC